MKETLIAFLICALIFLAALFHSNRADNLLNELKLKGYSVREYETPFFDSGPFWRTKHDIIIKITLDDGTVVWAKSGIFWNDFLTPDGRNFLENR